MSRTINLDVPTLPDPQIMAWFQANGIDPNIVPAAQEVTVDGDKLTYLEFEASEDGNLRIAYDNAGNSYRPKRTVTTTMTALPESFGL